MPDIFISYSRADADVADRLAELCRQSGARIWTDTKLRAGDNWDDKLTEAVQSCDTFLVLVSNAALSTSRDSCSNEWSAICERNWTNPRVRVIPIRLDEAKLPAFLGNRKALDGRDERRLRACALEIPHYPAADPNAEKLDNLTMEESSELKERLRALLNALRDQENSSPNIPKEGGGP